MHLAPFSSVTLPPPATFLRCVSKCVLNISWLLAHTNCAVSTLSCSPRLFPLHPYDLRPITRILSKIFLSLSASPFLYPPPDPESLEACYRPLVSISLAPMCSPSWVSCAGPRPPNRRRHDPSFLMTLSASVPQHFSDHRFPTPHVNSIAPLSRSPPSLLPSSIPSF